MQGELSIGNAHGIKNSVHTGCGPSGGQQWVIKVGFTIFDERFVSAEMAAQALLGTPYYSKVVAFFARSTARAFPTEPVAVARAAAGRVR
jgi:hypothetical protein